MNICGCLVHAAPDMVESVARAASAMDGVEIHARTDDGRLVVVVEDVEGSLASETIMAMHQIPGVVSLALTYHHFEDLQGGEDAPQPVATPCTT
ncbi:periplasmic nitrate reductase chaperone NapD [Aliiruegeria haliotis]|uniref:Chaperone NapD n=1 Tax=Aliiruegeria haliotis TaxID=1280846 RepID=A0A2T0RVG5_9RHOB|nr:chaperone NapD [Aliiruegeria haliotis]PRY25171.1 periplasmic nitrate reductase chaperone NapD [Aliiruegeria haliotis]